MKSNIFHILLNHRSLKIYGNKLEAFLFYEQSNIRLHTVHFDTFWQPSRDQSTSEGIIDYFATAKVINTRYEIIPSCLLLVDQQKFFIFSQSKVSKWKFSVNFRANGLSFNLDFHLLYHCLIEYLRGWFFDLTRSYFTLCLTTKKMIGGLIGNANNCMLRP